MTIDPYAAVLPGGGGGGVTVNIARFLELEKLLWSWRNCYAVSNSDLHNELLMPCGLSLHKHYRFVF